MTPAERFSMCMAEAGWPLDVGMDARGFIRWFPQASDRDPLFWRAAHKAARLSGCGSLAMRACVDCYVAFKLRHPTPAPDFKVSDVCSHAEVSA